MNFRPALSPGTVAFRRDRHHLQIGTAPGVSFRDRPGLLAALRLVDGMRDCVSLESLAAKIPDFDGSLTADLLDLHRSGAVLDARAWDIAGPAADEALALAVEGTPAEGIAERLQRRAMATLDFVGDTSCRALASGIASITREAGVASMPSHESTLTVVMTAGEADREIFTSLVSEGRDHLPVVLSSGVVRWGPVVRPQETPCVTCHDLHRADFDPTWSALVTQFGTGGSRERVCEALGATTRHAAAAAIAADIVSHCDRTGGPALTHQVGLGERTSLEVGFHDGCGCRLLSRHLS
ncbi:cyclodehydratase [soil metagenome]